MELEQPFLARGGWSPADPRRVKPGISIRQPKVPTDLLTATTTATQTDRL